MSELLRMIDITRSIPPRKSVKREKLAAQDLTKAPGPQSKNRVKNRAQRLSRILWRGSQWAVTTYGLEARDGGYAISKDRLWEGEEEYGWVQHMAEKNWVDLTDFAEALRVARIMERDRP